MKTKSFIRAGAALAAAVLFSSCFEVTNNIALNPDGSGKFVYKTSMPAMPMNFNFGDGADAPAIDTKQLAKDAARKLVKESKGVDVWEKLDFVVTEDGKMTISASGYFKDVSKLQIGDNESGPSFSDGMTFKKDDNGNLVLEMSMDMSDGEAPAEKPNLTKEQIMEKVKQGRAQCGKGQSKPE